MINFLFEKLDMVDSTNDYLVREVDFGKINKDKILIARMQTNGHGLSDKTFISPENVGIYFSFLHFYNDMSELKFITQKAAVAVYKTFKEIFDIELSIKWVNDLFYNNKKVCGILCKNLIKHKACLVGIGIDLFKNENIDKSIKDIAGYIFEDKKDLIDKLENNKNLSDDNCIKKNIYEDFKSLKLPDIEIDDRGLWEADQLVIQIVMHIYTLIKIEGLPKLYIEKNIIKDKKIYEDCDLEC